MILINGEQTEIVSVKDRGLHYGDGVFETLAVRDGVPELWRAHLRRLAQGCARLGIPAPDGGLLAHEAAQVCAGVLRGVLKIIVTRGGGGRGYGPPERAHPTRVVALYPWPEYPDAYISEGVALRVCATPLGCNPALAGLKHLNRLEQVLARGEWSGAEWAEGLMLDGAGHVIEGTMSNVFMVRDGALVTPDLSQCGVVGVMRELIVDVANGLGIGCNTGHISLDEFKNAQELFLCNSLIRIWPVRELEGARYGLGPVTQRIRAGLDDRIDRERAAPWPHGSN